MTITYILGWVLYIAVVLFANSGFFHIWGVASGGGSVTKVGLFQWVLSVTCAVMFGLTDIHKLHILWVVPVGYIISLTPIGYGVGRIVGIITSAIFGSKMD